MPRSNPQVLEMVKKMALPEVMDHRTLAPFLDLSPKSVAALCRKGELPGVRVGKRWIITRAALLTALDPRKPRLRVVAGGSRG
jgi:hypothetical protein